jgi:ornithine cyclodeaminase/alanine dehydrogenase-like protein (mu-crystallin family)
VYVTVHGKPSAVLLATEDLESLEETIEILADADAMRRLHASEAELARGEVESDPGQPRLFKSVGMAWEDAVVASALIDRTENPKG